MNRLNLYLVNATVKLIEVHNAINEDELRGWINGYLDPLKRILLLIVPTFIGIYVAIQFIQRSQREAEGQEQPPFWTIIKKAVIGGILVEAIDAILVIFGI